VDAVRKAAPDVPVGLTLAMSPYQPVAGGEAMIAGVGLASIFGFDAAAAETAGDVPAEVTYTLSVLSELFFIPFAMGLLVALLATAVVILRHGGLLPRWLGFVVIAIAVMLLTPARLGAAIARAIWILSVSVLLFLRAEPAAPVDLDWRDKAMERSTA
jgi:hypothetical protein